MDMSLEDIIRRKKKENMRNKPLTTKKFRQDLPKKQGSVKPKISVTDARNKIISRKRTKINDAREKLIQLAKQKDARFKLEQLRKQRQAVLPPQRSNPLPNQGKLTRTVSNNRRFTDPSRQVFSRPHGRLMTNQGVNSKRYMDMVSSNKKAKETLPLQPITRTVHNDLDIIDSLMGDEYIPPRAAPLNSKLRIIAHNNDARGRFTATNRLSPSEKEPSPPRPPSILKKRPMAALRKDKKTTEKTEKPALEYRIIVSNLRNTVTGGDIEELFGDVGGMVESRLVRPGTAEVIYKTVEDAQKAVDLYHNRQLDGQPMNCLLVTPRSSTLPTRSTSKPALYSTNSNVEPDIETFHKVLFSHF